MHWLQQRDSRSTPWSYAQELALTLSEPWFKQTLKGRLYRGTCDSLDVGGMVCRDFTCSMMVNVRVVINVANIRYRQYSELEVHCHLRRHSRKRRRACSEFLRMLKSFSCSARRCFCHVLRRTDFQTANIEQNWNALSVITCWYLANFCLFHSDHSDNITIISNFLHFSSGSSWDQSKGSLPQVPNGFGTVYATS